MQLLQYTAIVSLGVMEGSVLTDCYIYPRSFLLTIFDKLGLMARASSLRARGDIIVKQGCFIREGYLIGS